MNTRIILACSFLAAVAAACGGTTSLGDGKNNLGQAGNSGSAGTAGSGSGGAAGVGGGPIDGGAYDPCNNLPCGAPCSPCDPMTGETCIAVAMYCAADGSCGLNYPVCEPGACTTDEQCPQMGAPCQQCADGSYACPSVTCEAGQCVGSFPTCQGTQCTTDKDCPMIGAPCQQCPDGTVSCPSVSCVSGQCVGSQEACSGYAPCSSASCGQPCTQCDPNDPTCIGPAVMMWCNEAGVCDMNYPQTCGGGGSVCQSDADCPAVGACPPCADGQCAALTCKSGACEFACPSPAVPQCHVASDCPAMELCKACPDGSCAQQDCVNGTCEFVCGL